MVMSAFATAPTPRSSAHPEVPQANQVWQRVLAQLQSRTSEAHFETYLRGTLGLAYDPGASVLRVAAANPFHVPWLEGKFSSAIHTAIADVLGAPVRVEFVAEPSLADTTTRPTRIKPAPLLASLEERGSAASVSLSSRPRVPGLSDKTTGSPLNVRYTFDTFVVGQ